MCLGIVQAHGGMIEVGGPAAGGTAFIMTLPLVTVEHTPAPGARAEFSAARRRVLVVDDEQEVRDVLGDILTIANHDMRLCSAGAQALELLSQEHFDAIISDVRMPGMDGVDLYRHVQARWPDLAQRMVFMTGDSLSATHQQFISGTGQPCLDKPFAPDDVCRTLDHVCATVLRKLRR